MSDSASVNPTNQACTPSVVEESILTPPTGVSDTGGASPVLNPGDNTSIQLCQL